MKHRMMVILFLGIILTLIFGTTLTVSAAGESFQVISVDATGCSNGQFRMTVQRANLDGGTYRVRTVVTVGSLIYMNEDASITINGLSNWNIFDNFTYGPVPNQGTYPIPAGQTMTLDFTLERPKGTILYTWRLIVDGCNTGNILFNGVPTVGGCNLSIPAGSVVGEAPAGAQAYYAPDQVAPGVVLNPGTYIVIGQDESETYYRVVLACQLLWVRKDTMQPSFQAPQNGAPLPTRIVS